MIGIGCGGGAIGGIVLVRYDVVLAKILASCSSASISLSRISARDLSGYDFLRMEMIFLAAAITLSADDGVSMKTWDGN